MAVERIWDRSKTIAKTLAPGAYGQAWGLKEGVKDLVRYPFVTIINLADIDYLMKVGSRQEEGVACGTFFERELIDEMLTVVEPGSVCLDIGAATGTHAIPLAVKSGPQGVVYAMEPDGECSSRLRSNITLNGLNNIEVFQLAAWSEDTNLTLHTSGVKGDAPQVVEDGRAVSKRLKRKVTVPARSIASLVEKGEMREPDLVKIDVEGAELQVLGGMDGLFPRHVFVEVHPTMGARVDQVRDLMLGRGYSVVSEVPRDHQVHVHFAL